MSASSFDASLKLVLAHEGGYVDHPADPGGATNLGVTIGTLSDWLGRPATKAEVKALTKASVAPIYRKNYWDKVKGDALPPGLDYCVFDYAVNSGVSRAAKALQGIIGTPQDGAIGPATLEKVGRSDSHDLINRLCDHRLGFLKGLSTWGTFGKGWSNRVAGVRASALKMAKEVDKPVDPDIGIPITPPPDTEPTPPPATEPAVSFWARLWAALTGRA